MRVPHNEPLDVDIVDGRPADKGSPERRCIVSGAHGSRDDFVRLAIAPDGQVFPDALARAPGRGAWLGIDRAALDEAVAKGKLKGALGRAFKGAAMGVPADLGAMVEAALTRAFTDRLGLEMRAGRLLLGSDRIAEHARSGRVAWLAHAADAGEDGSRKLDQAWRVGRDAEGSGHTGTTLPLDRASLSVALGRDNVVHLALTDSAAAARVAVPLGRLMRFLGRASGPDAGSADEDSGDPAVLSLGRIDDDEKMTKDATVR
ncbi:DUF448 domain-containing protein [Novosphingobium tardum]|uniref:DUF448 domain-containing protein n=1 Tax=Novosphingobium tardum TaxID=1538021 RepID=A0ABV8RRG6_9SPHN